MFTSQAEMGADFGKLNWGAKESFMHSTTIGGVIITDAFFIGITNCFEGFASVGKFSSHNFASADFFTIQMLFFIHDFEAVTFLNVECKVDIPTKNVRQFHGQS